MVGSTALGVVRVGTVLYQGVVRVGTTMQVGSVKEEKSARGTDTADTG